MTQLQHISNVPRKSHKNITPEYTLIHALLFVLQFLINWPSVQIAFSALTLLVGRQEEHVVVVVFFFQYNQSWTSLPSIVLS